MNKVVQVDYQVNGSNEVIIKTTDGNICVEENLGVVNSDPNTLAISEQKGYKLDVVNMVRFVMEEVLGKECVLLGKECGPLLTCKGVDFAYDNTNGMIAMEFYNTVFNHVMEIVSQDIMQVISPMEDGKTIIEALQRTLKHLKNNYDIDIDFYVEDISKG